MALMGQREYARHRESLGLPGVTHRAVQKQIAKGTIAVDANGKIDSEAADVAWALNADEGHRRNPGQERPPAPRPAPAVDAPDPVAPPVLASAERVRQSFAGANAVEKTFKAKLAQLQYEERSGKLVSADEVRARWLQVVSLVRTKVLGLPSKIRQRLTDLSLEDVSAIEELVRESLEEIADAAA